MNTFAKLKDGTRTYQRWLKPGEIDAWTANLVDAWLRAKMAAKQGWTFAPSRRR